MSKTIRINKQINVKSVRLISAEGDQLGIVSLEEALETAEKESLDLVEIAPNASPPVCRVMDYGKYRYEQKKKEASQRKGQVQEIKEVKFTPSTDVNDYQIKLNKIMDFLLRNKKVKVSLRFRGREMSHQELGKRLMERLVVDIGEKGKIEQPLKLEGRQLLMVVAPQKK